MYFGQTDHSLEIVEVSGSRVTQHAKSFNLVEFHENSLHNFNESCSTGWLIGSDNCNISLMYWKIYKWD